MPYTADTARKYMGAHIERKEIRSRITGKFRPFRDRISSALAFKMILLRIWISAHMGERTCAYHSEGLAHGDAEMLQEKLESQGFQTTVRKNWLRSNKRGVTFFVLWGSTGK